MRKWSAAGTVVIILATCVGGAWAAALVVTVLQDGAVPSEVTALLDTLGGILAGAIVGWLTSEWVHHRAARDDDVVDDVDDGSL